MTFLHGIIDVLVSTLLKHLPDPAISFECLCGILGSRSCLIHKERYDTVLTDVFSDVFLGIVCTHGSTVIDVLLEDVTQHVWVDVLAAGGETGVEVPVPLIEEVEEIDKRLIGNINACMFTLQLVVIEHATVQIRYATIHRQELFCIMTRIVQTFVEHSTKESLIERTKKLVFALLLTYPLEFVLQVVGIHIKEALFLNEVTEHESVEHNAGIPILVLVIIDTRNVFLEGSMLLAELRIEVLSDLLTVQMERAMHTILDICNQNALGEFEGQVINL